MESKDLRTSLRYYVSVVRRSFDSLCSLRMIYNRYLFINHQLRYRWLVGGVMTPPYI